MALWEQKVCQVVEQKTARAYTEHSFMYAESLKDLKESKRTFFSQKGM